MNCIDEFVAAVVRPHMQSDGSPRPFDGQRMVYGGFEVLLKV